MSQMLRDAMTPEEFLAWEVEQERKWEFDGFQPVAMVGVTVAHSIIQGNIITALNNRLQRKPCQPYGPEVKVEIGPKYRYPDAFMSCTPLARDATVVADPVAIFELLSESTARTDRTTKLTEYCSLSSMQRYVMLEQTKPLPPWSAALRPAGAWRRWAPLAC